jgi:hypothetical protein
MPGHMKTGRMIENFLVLVGALQITLAASLESLTHAGVKLGSCVEFGGPWYNHVPWFNLVVLLVCILPKTIGRATAGKVWETLANKVPGGGASA